MHICNENTTFEGGNGKIETGSRTMVQLCLFTFCKIPNFVIFENTSAKANGRREDIYHMNVNMYVICWNYLKFFCNLMFL